MRVFLDLDGVLVAFTEGACRHHGIPNPYHCPSGRWLGVWEFTVGTGIPPELFWQDLGLTFWRDLEAYPDAAGIVAAVEEFDPGYAVLTSPCLTVGSPDGKYLWVERMLGKHVRPRTIMCNRKGLVAGPGKVLVDDSDANCADWEECGGLAILVPRPWNSLHDLTHLGAAAYVRDALAAARDRLSYESR